VLIVDTGPLLATADRADKDHLACRALLEGEPGPLVTTAMVIAEAAYLIDRQLGPIAEAGLYTAITAGQLEVADLTGDDWARIGELVTGYADLRLGGTDASVIAVAERYGATRIATLNHRHFHVVRPRHTPAFTLLPG
jgi:predicted nucleic acid-binding protein